MEINSKAFAIPILTASTLTLNTDLGGNVWLYLEQQGTTMIQFQ